MRELNLAITISYGKAWHTADGDAVRNSGRIMSNPRWATMYLRCGIGYAAKRSGLKYLIPQKIDIVAEVG